MIQSGVPQNVQFPKVAEDLAFGLELSANVITGFFRPFAARDIVIDNKKIAGRGIIRCLNAISFHETKSKPETARMLWGVTLLGIFEGALDK